MKKTILLYCLATSWLGVAAQSINHLTLEECYISATANYPLIKQKDLIAKTKAYSLDNATKGYLPQITMNGQVSYQSDVTQIPFTLPDREIPALSKDQYKVYGEIYQPLTEGYLIRKQKQLIESNTMVEEQKLEVELYNIKDRVNQLFFGIILIKAQMEQVTLLEKDIQSAIDKTNASIANGTALKSSVEVLKAEVLKSDQRMIELRSNHNAYTDMLGILINKTIDENTEFLTPPEQEVTATIKRPELKLFDVQHESMDVQKSILEARKIPKVGLFLQGGYGKPTLNFLKNEFNFYYIGGIKFNWALSGLYSYKNDKELIDINQNAVNIQKETFLFNTNLSLSHQQNEINKLNQLIAVDEQIITVYESIKNSYSAQLQNGTITTSDFLTHVNAVDVARQNLVLHKVQLLMAQYNYKTTSGTE